MRWLPSSYTLRSNHRRRLTGHVFSARYKALIVEGSGDGYLETVRDDVHLNPVRARLIGPEDRWQEAHLRQRPKSDPERLRIAARLRRETTLTIGWIAERLRLGTRKSATTRLQEYKAGKPAGTW